LNHSVAVAPNLMYAFLRLGKTIEPNFFLGSPRESAVSAYVNQSRHQSLPFSSEHAMKDDEIYVAPTVSTAALRSESINHFLSHKSGTTPTCIQAMVRCRNAALYSRRDGTLSSTKARSRGTKGLLCTRLCRRKVSSKHKNVTVRTSVPGGSQTMPKAASSVLLER
jgi:hypothetical protein